MAKKVTILAQGFRKRGNEAKAQEYEERLRRAGTRVEHVKGLTGQGLRQ